MPGADGKEKLMLIAKQAGFSEESFEQCLADKELFDKIVAVRKKAHEDYGVDSTPSFFVNGKRLPGVRARSVRVRDRGQAGNTGERLSVRSDHGRSAAFTPWN